MSVSVITSPINSTKSPNWSSQKGGTWAYQTTTLCIIQFSFVTRKPIMSSFYMCFFNLMILMIIPCNLGIHSGTVNLIYASFTYCFSFLELFPLCLFHLICSFNKDLGKCLHNLLSFCRSSKQVFAFIPRRKQPVSKNGIKTDTLKPEKAFGTR